MYIVPFTCLAVFNLLIYTEVRRANSARSSLTRLQKKEIGLANLLMVVVMVFFVCNILALVVNILEVFEYNIIALHNVSNLLVTFNSSVNLIIYCIFGEKFKRIFCQLFCHRTGGRGDGMQDHPFLTRYPQSKVVIVKLQLLVFNWSLIWNILIIFFFYIPHFLKWCPPLYNVLPWIVSPLFHKIQGAPYVFERCSEAVLRPWVDVEMKSYHIFLTQVYTFQIP